MDRRIKLGIVGLGFGTGWYRIHKAEIDPFFEVIAVCDKIQERCQEFLKIASAEVYADFDEMLQKADIQAVALMTQPQGRANLVRKCAAAGKHILTTKPFERDAQAAFDVLNEVRSAGIVVQLNSPNPELSDELRTIFDWQKEYDLGRPISAHWESYNRYDEKSGQGGAWMDSVSECPAAPIFRIGIYGVNDLLALMGEVKSVQVTTSRIFTGRPTPDNAHLLMLFENGATASVNANFCISDGYCYPATLMLHYERGTIFKRQISLGVERENWGKFTSLELELHARFQNKTVSEKKTLSPDFRSGSFQMENFYKAIRGDKSIGTQDSASQIAHGIAVFEAISDAEISGKQVSVKKIK